MIKILCLILLSFILVTTICNAQTGDTLGDLNPAKFNKDFSSYNQNTALYLAQISELSYADSMSNFNNFLFRYMSKYPAMHIRTEFIYEKSKTTNTQILLWAMPDYLIIGFRGTENKWGNILTDLKYWIYDDRDSNIKQSYSNLPGGHGGFRSAIRNLINNTDIISKLKIFIQQTYGINNISRIPVYLTGHSLGAALAALIAEPFRYSNINIQGMYLFAPPLAVSCSYQDSLQIKFGATTHNIINYKDYVPRAGYRGTLAHFGRFYRICDDLTLSKEPERYVKMTYKEGKREISYHKLASYIAALRLPKNQIANNLDCFKGEQIKPQCPIQ